MARKSKRRPIRRTQRNRAEEQVAEQRWLDAAAHNLLNGRSLEQLVSVLHDCELMLSEADRAAQVDPSPPNLARYRHARSQAETARRALDLARTTGA